ncbi:MAG TPA: hypothetical protein VFE85_08810 [Woeseiaceae bacterium]|nr:hypothetical protein [Woeseiaceae bacterium]
MPEPAGSPRGSRLQFLLVALAFIVPLLGAVLLYNGGDAWRPGGSTNHGTLLSPIVNLDERLPGSDLGRQVADHWALVYINDGPCRNACREALYTLRQSRLMLGHDMNRLLRVFLHGTIAPDRVFLEREHAGLVTLHEPAAALLLQAERPVGSAAGGYFLLDPLGNLVMYFPADIVPRDMVDDIAHLLDLSRIG